MLRSQVLDLLGGEKMLVHTRQAKQRPSPALARGKDRKHSSRSRGAMKVAEEPPPYGGPAAGASVRHQSPFRISAIDNLAKRLDVSPDHLMIVLGITGRTGQRRRQQGVLSAEESDRLYRLARIIERAFEVLGSEEAARHWLRRPQAILTGAAPLALLGSEAGAQAVEQQLGRIDYGDLY